MVANTARSAAMRGRLLDAAFEALVEVGYAKTSTLEVMKRAAVSRGALLHHFPKREKLLAAAVEHVFLRRLDEYRDAFASLPPDPVERAERAIEALWAILAGPAYYAWLELVVAARTDAVLLEEVRAVMERFGPLVQQTYESMFPAPAAPHPDHDLGSGFAFATLNGLAVDRIFASAEDCRPTVDALKRVAAAVMGDER